MLAQTTLPYQEISYARLPENNGMQNYSDAFLKQQIEQQYQSIQMIANYRMASE